MFIVSKGKDRVSTPDKENAKAIVNALNDLDSYEAIAIRSIEGLADKLDTFTVKFSGHEVDVLGKDSVLQLTLWVLMLNCSNITITRKEEK